MNAPSLALPDRPLHARQEHARLLLRIEAALSASLDLEATLRAAAWLAVPQLGDWCLVDLRAEDGEWRRIGAAHARPADASLATRLLEEPFDAAAAEALAAAGEPFVREGRDGPFSHENEAVSLLHAPLVERGTVRGLLTFARIGAAARHDASAMSLAGEVAARAADAVRRASGAQVADPRLATERAVRIQAIAAAFADTLTPEEVAEVALRQGVSALGARAGSVSVLSDDGGCSLLLRGLGYPDDVLEQWSRVPLTVDFPMTDAIRLGHPLYVGSYEERLARYPHLRSLADRNGTGGMAAVPLIADGRPFGAIGLSFPEPRGFGPEERAFAETLARLCSLALQRTRLFEAERRARERVALIADASRLLGTTLDYERTLRHVAQMAAPALADFCFFDLRQPDGDVRRTAWAHEDPVVQAILDGSRWVASERTDLNVCALSSGKSGFHPVIDRRLRENMAVNAGHLAVLEKLQLCAMVTVPLSADGDVYGALTLCYGHSGRRYEAADLPFIEELAHRASAAVQNARLMRQAKEAIEHRDAFLSIASHELNTPLTALSLQLSNLRRRPPTPERHQEVIDRSLKQTQRLSRLVSELLDVTRITEGRLRLEREPFDLAALAQEVAARLGEDTSLPRITVHAAGPAMVTADRLRCEQVITNLLSNALKYGRGRPVDVELETRPQEVRLTVRDRGLGIAPEQQQRIFQRFERAVSSRSYEGLGLGLWIVREIVDAHRGSISLESRPDEGSAFTVTLPRGVA